MTQQGQGTGVGVGATVSRDAIQAASDNLSPAAIAGSVLGGLFGIGLIILLIHSRKWRMTIRTKAAFSNLKLSMRTSPPTMFHPFALLPASTSPEFSLMKLEDGFSEAMTTTSRNVVPEKQSTSGAAGVLQTKTARSSCGRKWTASIWNWHRCSTIQGLGLTPVTRIF